MLSLILEYRDEAQTVFGWALCIAALVWGGGPERAIALLWLFLFEITSLLISAIWSPSFRPSDLDVTSMLIDSAALIILIIVAVRANRMYPLWIAAFQILATMSHFANAMANHISPIAYVILAVTPGYFQLLILAAGLLGHMRRVREHGAYRDWQRPIASVQAIANDAALK